MDSPGDFWYYAVASDIVSKGIAFEDGDESIVVKVSVGEASREVKGFTLSKSSLNVGETVKFTVTTGKLANKVSILDALDAEFASSTKPSRATCTKKIWTIKRTLTEADMGSLSLRARVGTKYGDGPASAAKTLTVTDNLPRVISSSWKPRRQSAGRNWNSWS